MSSSCTSALACCGCCPWDCQGCCLPFFENVASLDCVFYVSLFLVALASRPHASQLHALASLFVGRRLPQTLSCPLLLPPFLSESRREARRLAPVVLLSWAVCGWFISVSGSHSAAVYERHSTGPSFLPFGSSLVLFVLARWYTLPWCFVCWGCCSG